MYTRCCLKDETAAVNVRKGSDTATNRWSNPASSDFIPNSQYPEFSIPNSQLAIIAIGCETFPQTYNIILVVLFFAVDHHDRHSSSITI